ncbi:MAG TPA: tyrosine-type recombinase/integrase [Candidatus Avacidaminococcus intestinavium]|uniref:Tyrosine-type recombinase/integrase n=1 Tax=Candidatus Avacidaminococcus intestinavium TaxID=2840684 RepID=A0A9D1MQM3_9FIRM|nr:tyrosine-type recombinase/integrase [Candidatus Avacidaminococcus intestinavium]
MATTDPIRDKKNVKRLINYFKERDKTRNCLLVVMGVHTALRISDILKLTWQDVYDFEKRRLRKTISLTENKTGKKKTIALNKDIIETLTLYAKERSPLLPKDYIFRSQIAPMSHISRVQAYRIIKEAAVNLGLEGNIACHSLRKTFGYHAWKGKFPVPVIMEIYNHTSFDVTRKYLGISQDDKNKIYLNMSFFK